MKGLQTRCTPPSTFGNGTHFPDMEGCWAVRQCVSGFLGCLPLHFFLSFFLCLIAHSTIRIPTLLSSFLCIDRSSPRCRLVRKQVCHDAACVNVFVCAYVRMCVCVCVSLSLSLFILIRFLFTNVCLCVRVSVCLTLSSPCLYLSLVCFFLCRVHPSHGPRPRHNGKHGAGLRYSWHGP